MKRLLVSLLLLTTLLSAVSFGPAAAQSDGCPPLPTRLAVGMSARVTPGDPNRLRSTFAIGANQIGTIPGGSALTIVGGPECRDGFRWWQVETSNQTGWTVEGSDTIYYLEPDLPRLAPAERWGYGTPRDVAWTPDYIAVAGTAGVFIYDPADPTAAPRRLLPMDTWPSRLAADPADPNRLAVLNGSQVTIWDVANGAPLLSWREGGTSQYGPEFSRDGARLLTAGGSQAFVWDAQTGALIQAVGDEAAPVGLAALSPDGSQIFTGSREGGLALWDVAGGAKLRTDFRYNPDLGLTQTTALAFTPDGSGVVAGDMNGHIRYWSLEDAGDYVEYERPYRGDPATPRVLAFRFLPDGRFLTAEDSAGGGVRLWTLDDAITPVAQIDPPGFSNAARLAISPDGTQFVVPMHYEDGYRVEIVEVESFAVVGRVGDFQYITGFALSGDGALLMTEGSGSPRLYNTADGSIERELTTYGKYVSGAAFSEDNMLITACVNDDVISYDPTVEAWSLRESYESFTLQDKFAFSRGGTCYQTYVTENTFGFLSFDGLYTQPIVGPGEFEPTLTDLSLGRTYSALAGGLGVFGHEATGFTLFDQDAPETGQRTFPLLWQPTYEPTGTINVALDAAGTRLARRSETVSNGVDIYDLTGDEAELLFTAVSDVKLTTLAFSADARWLASGHENGKVMLWDVNAQRAVATLDGANGNVYTLAFSPDGDRLYGASQNSVITIWALDALP